MIQTPNFYFHFESRGDYSSTDDEGSRQQEDGGGEQILSPSSNQEEGDDEEEEAKRDATGTPMSPPSCSSSPQKDQSIDQEEEPGGSTVSTTMVTRKRSLAFFSEVFVPPPIIHGQKKTRVVAPVNTWLGGVAEGVVAGPSSNSRPVVLHHDVTPDAGGGEDASSTVHPVVGEDEDAPHASTSSLASSRIEGTKNKGQSPKRGRGSGGGSMSARQQTSGDSSDDIQVSTSSDDDDDGEITGAKNLPGRRRGTEL